MPFRLNVRGADLVYTLISRLALSFVKNPKIDYCSVQFFHIPPFVLKIQFPSVIKKDELRPPVLGSFVNTPIAMPFLPTALLRGNAFIVKEVLYRIFLRYFSVCAPPTVQPIREPNKKTLNQRSSAGFKGGSRFLASKEKKACLVVCLWLLHFSPVASWKFCRNMTTRANEDRPSENLAPVIVVRSFVPQSQFLDQYRSLGNPSSSATNVRSFGRRNVILTFLFQDERRSSCRKWDEKTGAFVMRKKPRPSNWRKAKNVLPKRWFVSSGQ